MDDDKFYAPKTKKKQTRYMRVNIWDNMMRI